MGSASTMGDCCPVGCRGELCPDPEGVPEDRLCLTGAHQRRDLSSGTVAASPELLWL